MNRESIQAIGQIGVPIKDFDRAVHFYRDILELPLLFTADNLAFFDCNGIRLFLSLPENEDIAKMSSIIYYRVNDIFTSYEDYKEKGVSFIDEPHLIAKMGRTESWMVFFHDSEGNMLALMSEFEA